MASAGEQSMSEQAQAVQLTLPDPILLTWHFAPPPISALPEPKMLTEALPVALSSALPDPAIDRFS